MHPTGNRSSDNPRPVSLTVNRSALKTRCAQPMSTVEVYRLASRNLSLHTHKLQFLDVFSACKDSYKSNRNTMVSGLGRTAPEPDYLTNTLPREKSSCQPTPLIELCCDLASRLNDACKGRTPHYIGKASICPEV